MPPPSYRRATQIIKNVVNIIFVAEPKILYNLSNIKTISLVNFTSCFFSLLNSTASLEEHWVVIRSNPIEVDKLGKIIGIQPAIIHKDPIEFDRNSRLAESICYTPCKPKIMKVDIN